jgi:formiminotetrahydrofolate cyclodeaminase
MALLPIHVYGDDVLRAIAAAQSWANHLESIANAGAEANVVPTSVAALRCEIARIRHSCDELSIAVVVSDIQIPKGVPE